LSKITICPIGTCRINTPLKRGAARFPIELDYRRVYGFVHTAREAIQQLRYRHGEIAFSPEESSVVFRSGHKDNDKPVEDKLPDLTIVEISSTKTFLLGEVAIQGNYLYQRFADFFARPARARAYFELARRGDKEELEAFLKSDPVYNRYEAADRDILANLRMGVQTFEDVQAEMSELVDMIGKDRIMFVTHVNVTMPDGSLIASRDKLIRWVKLAASELGVPCFDPSEPMLEFGQERAMERSGLDSTHFTTAFSDAWFAKVQRDYIFSRFTASGMTPEEVARSEASRIAETIAATLQHLDFFEGSRELFAALKAHPDDAALLMLYGQVLSRIGDYDGAIKLLAPHSAGTEMSNEMRQALMRAQIETGHPAGALEVASQMLGEEYQNAEIYEVAGRAAEQLGRADDAVRYRKLAFRRDPTTRGTAIPVLEHYKSTGKLELYEAWLAEVMEVLEEREDAVLASSLAEWAIARREDDALGRALAIVAQKDAGMLPGLIEEASRVGMYSALTTLAMLVAEIPGLVERAAKPLRGLAQNWADTAQLRLDEGNIREAHLFAAACVAVHPNHSAARTVRRAVVDALWKEVQSARDEQQVVALCDVGGDIIYDRRSIGLLYSRALARVGRVGDAEAVARKMHERAPEDIDIAANFAILAAMNGSFRTALELYGGLSEKDSELIERYENRMQAFMATAGAKGVRYMRITVADGQYKDAVATCELLQKYALLASEQITSEGGRILSALRAHLRQLDEQEAGSREILDVLTLMLSLAPDDPRLLRRAGIEYMNAEQFERALEFWRRLETVSPEMQSARNNIQRCEILARRQARKLGTRRSAVSLAA
jgi:Flp pilus assembly protein TadD